MSQLKERAPTAPPPSLDHHTGVVAGAVWMVVLSLALFFVPGLNGLIAGLVGGYLVGSPGRALAARGPSGADRSRRALDALGRPGDADPRVFRRRRHHGPHCPR